MPNLVVRLNDEQAASLTHSKKKTGIAKEQIARRAIGLYLFQEHGIVFPGYEPEECLICSEPISKHTLHSATATEPGGLECPAPDDEIPY